MKTKLMFNLHDDLSKFDLGDSGACPGSWQGCEALHLHKVNSAIFLQEEVPFASYRLQADVVIPEHVGFIGFAFGARDAENFELIYLAPEEIQYDPVMNGSMTWQVYNGPSYQKPLPNTTGEWRKFTVDVEPSGATVYLGDDPEPQLVIKNLQHGGAPGKVGIWNFLSSYIRNFTIEEITPTAPIEQRLADQRQLQSDSFITEWQISQPYIRGNSLADQQEWTTSVVEENGTLNINRIHKAGPDSTVLVKGTVTVPEGRESILSLGFSDHIRLWVNDKEVYQGDWNWNPPASDGRVRSSFARIPVQWQPGENTVTAEVSQSEFFGWGLSVQTGL